MSLGFGPIIRHGLRRGLGSKAGFSRREILRAGLAASAGLALASIGCATKTTRSAATQPSATATGDGPRVAVVGAGLAGLACADVLVRGGADVTVFEASHRAGGRVLTDRRFIPGKCVELGGEFIGSNHPLWIEYARRFGIALVTVTEDDGDDAILLGGRVIQGEQADRLYQEIDQSLATTIDIAQPIDPVRPWTSPGAQALDRKSYSDFLRELTLSTDARRLLATIAEADNGVPPQRMSMLGYCAMVAGGGFAAYFKLSETHRALGGNDALATALANSLGQRVRYSAAVLSIQRDKSHAVVLASRGASFECDAVVLAIAPSVWRRIAFTSPLGDRVPQMGRNVKLITKVQYPAWQEQQLGAQLVSDGLVQMTWLSADGAAPNLPRSLTLFSGGRRADELRAIDPRQRRQRALDSIQSAYPTLPGTVMEDRFIDWPGMANVMGSYSFPAPGEVIRYGPILVDGWNDDLAPLRFAGEHTSYGFLGYMEGALQSGVRVADSILARSPASASTTQPRRM